MWLEKMGRKWEKKKEKKGKKEPFLTVPFPPFFQRSKIFPTVPFVKISSLHSAIEKWDSLPLTNTYRHGGSCACLMLILHVQRLRVRLAVWTVDWCRVGPGAPTWLDLCAQRASRLSPSSPRASTSRSGCLPHHTFTAFHNPTSQAVCSHSELRSPTLADVLGAP